jgi:hypothetical protein
VIARRAFTFALLVAFLGFATGANAALCARECASAEHVHAQPVPVAGMQTHHHHHHAAAPVVPSAANLTVPAHCVRSAPPAVAERLLLQAPVAALAPRAAAPAFGLRANSGPVTALAAASPGPLFLSAPLRL